MGIFDDVAHSRGDRGRVPYRRDGDGLVPLVPESRGESQVSRIKSFFATLWYWITGKYNL